MGKNVKTDNLKPGMIIDRDVANHQGAVLLKKGSEITERHINIFKTWGINTVYIKEDVSSEDLGGKTPEEVADGEIRKACKIIDDKFKMYENDEIMNAIRDAAKRYKKYEIKRKYNIG